MSKTKGNVIDPLELIDGYGADATRFTLAAMAAQGRDLKLAMSRVEGYRNFVTKLWNAARFLEMNECAPRRGLRPARGQARRSTAGSSARPRAPSPRSPAPSRTSGSTKPPTPPTTSSGARFCDWYVELAKPVLTGEDVAASDETRATAAWVLDQILKLLHPFMPFVTEELWAETGKAGPARDKLLILADWPDLARPRDAEADAELDWLIDLISGIRSVRTEMNVPAGAKIPLVVVGAGDATRARLERQLAALTRLARLETVDHAADVPKGSAQIVLGEATFALPLAGVIDIDAEKARLGKEDRQSSTTRSARSTRSSATSSSSPRPPKRSSRSSATASPKPPTAASRIRAALARLS